MMSMLPHVSPSFLVRNGPSGEYPCSDPNPGLEASPQVPQNGSFTMLQGHIKLMAMVPGIPPESNRSPSACKIPASSPHSLPPITPRLMPSITEKYWTPPQQHGYLPPLPGPAQQASSHVQYPSMWLPTVPMNPSHHTFHQRPPAATMVSPMNYSHQIPYMSTGQVPWHPQQFACPYMNTPSASHFQNLPFHYPQSYEEYSQNKQQFQMGAANLPYSVQSSPCFLAGRDCNPYGFRNPFPDMSGQLPQQCASLPILSRKFKKKTSKMSTDAGVEEKVYIVVEDKVSSASSSSNTSISSNGNVERQAHGLGGQVATGLSVKPPNLALDHQPVQENQPGVAIFQKPEVCRTKTAVLGPAPSIEMRQEGSPQEEAIEMVADDPSPTCSTSAARVQKKEASVIVSVADCFMSDSSEAEQDPSFEPSVDAKRKSVLKRVSKFPVAPPPGAIFEDLDVSLTPDELRLYSSNYLLELLSSENWNDCHLSLNIVVRLARHHPQQLLDYMSDNHVILLFTLNHITSKKSALCRAALMTFTELFEKIPGALDNHLDKITDKLIVKSLAPNNFIRVECEKALTAMVANANLPKILAALESVRRKSSVRAAGLKTALARIALQVVKTAGVDSCVMNDAYAEKLIPMLFCFMVEPNSTIRMTAKEALGLLMNHLQFEAVIMKYVTFDRNSSEVFKKLDKMRGRCGKRFSMNRSRQHGHLY